MNKMRNLTKQIPAKTRTKMSKFKDNKLKWPKNQRVDITLMRAMVDQIIIPSIESSKT